jgi:tetratricopeptide (TPR) repeat protein
MIMKIQLCALCLLIQACSGRTISPVEYEVYRSPIDAFDKLNFLGVAASKDTPKALVANVVTEIGRCRQFKKTVRLTGAYKLPKPNSRDLLRGFRAENDKFRSDRYVHGILFVDVIDNKQMQKPVQTSLIRVKYKNRYDWFDSFGTTADLSSQAYSFEEIAKKPQYRARDVKVTLERQRYGVRYALYNIKKDKIVFDKSTSLQATVSNYSKTPTFSGPQVAKILNEHMIAKIARNACPKIGTARRDLLADSGATKADAMVRKGIELAVEEKWERAAEKWQNAILLNKNHGFAHHNLGIFYERTGNVPKAIEEFQRAKKSGIDESLSEDVFEDSIDQFRPEVGLAELNPQILTVTSSNLVKIIGGKASDLKVGKTYSIYRSKPLYSSKYEPQGIHLVEVGKVHVEKLEQQSPPHYLGRVVEFLKPYTIAGGDVVVSR